MSLHTLLYVSNFLYLGRPSARLRALAKPLLATLYPEDGAAAIGLHVRIGDSVLSKALNHELRYPPECGPCKLPHDEQYSCTSADLTGPVSPLADRPCSQQYGASAHAKQYHGKARTARAGVHSVSKVVRTLCPGILIISTLMFDIFLQDLPVVVHSAALLVCPRQDYRTAFSSCRSPHAMTVP